MFTLSLKRMLINSHALIRMQARAPAALLCDLPALLHHYRRHCRQYVALQPRGGLPGGPLSGLPLPAQLQARLVGGETQTICKFVSLLKRRVLMA